MSGRVWIHILAALALAMAALLLIRMHVADGAPLAQDSIAAGRGLAEAWCRDCHALEATGRHL